VIDRDDSLFVVNLADFAVERRIAIGLRPVYIHVAAEGALWALAIDGLFRVGQEAELLGEFSLDGYRVKAKRIIMKGRRGTRNTQSVWIPSAHIRSSQKHFMF
jgi:hypothetical protein